MKSRDQNPCYAVIFSSVRSTEDHEGYAAAAERMIELAHEQPGFLGVESARGDDGFGITVSYWSSLDAIRHWSEHAEHRFVQGRGKAEWYRHYRLLVCRVERETVFERDA